MLQAQSTTTAITINACHCEAHSVGRGNPSPPEILKIKSKSRFPCSCPFMCLGGGHGGNRTHPARLCFPNRGPAPWPYNAPFSWGRRAHHPGLTTAALSFSTRCNAGSQCVTPGGTLTPTDSEIRPPAAPIRLGIINSSGDVEAASDLHGGSYGIRPRSSVYPAMREPFS